MIFQAFRSIQQPWMSVLRQVSLVEHIKWQSSWGKFNPGRSFIFWGGNWAAWWCCGLHSCLIAATFQIRYLLRLSWCGDFPCDLPIQPGLETPKILKTTTTSVAFGSPWQQSVALPAISGITPEPQSSPQMSDCHSLHAFCPRLSSSFVYELISSMSVIPLLEVSQEL